jgi:predicted deacylase
VLLKNKHSQTKIYITALQKEIEIERILGISKGNKKTPTLIFLAGIHGNEKSGLYAIHEVLKKIKATSIPLKGNIYAISGNLNALKKGVRYENVDLNRIWSDEQIRTNQIFSTKFSKDVNEQIAIYNLIKKILSTEKGPFIFLDMHSTSAKTTPFITISDSINNRKFSKKFQLPIVLGIEEYLDGTFLSYINKFGHIALGFEAGQHNDIQSIKNSKAFIWLSLVNSGCINKRYIKEYKNSKRFIKDQSILKGNFFEIYYRYPINHKDVFLMHPNFVNFDPIKKYQHLATNNKEPVFSPLEGFIFMPLNQKQGDDGFFVVTKISIFWLYLSRLLRKLNFYYLLRLFPGIRQYKHDKNILIVNRKTANFLTLEIFHLFGYRKKVSKKGQWLFFKRDKKVKPFK